MNKFEILQKLHVTVDQKNRVETVVIDCILMAQKRYGPDKIKVIPEIRYNTKGRAAGLACMDPLTGKVWIDINPILLNENEKEMLEQTVPHEVAHCVIFMLYPNGRKQIDGTDRYFSKVESHGYEWQSVMRVFGLEPDRCHNMDISTVKAIRNGGVEHHYTCGCQVHKLTKIKHNRMQRGLIYRCWWCGNNLKFDKTVSVW